MAGPSLARRRRRLALGAGAALALVGGAIALTVASDRREAAARSAPLLDAAPERIIIVRTGFADVVLARAPAEADGAATDATDEEANDAWRVEAPCPLDASTARVAPLLEALEATRLTRDAADIDLPGAGLEPPVATLSIGDARIDVGGPDRTGGTRRYVRRGEAVGFAPEWLGALLGGGLTAFAEPAVLGAEAVAVDGDPDPARAAAWSALEAAQSVRSGRCRTRRVRDRRRAHAPDRSGGRPRRDPGDRDHRRLARDPDRRRGLRADRSAGRAARLTPTIGACPSCPKSRPPAAASSRISWAAR